MAMARIKEDIVKDIDDLKSRFNLVKDEFRCHFGISDISHVEMIDDILYLYFIDTNGNVTDRIHYTYLDGSRGDHVVKGFSLTDIYRDLEFVTVNYIFGAIC